MKTGKSLFILAVIMLGTAMAGRFTTSASEADFKEDQKTEAAHENSVLPETRDVQKTEGVKGGFEDKAEENVLKEEIETGKNDLTERTAGDEIPDADSEPDDETTGNMDDEAIGNMEDDIDAQGMDEDDISENLYYQGLRYYLNQYKYDCEIIYLQSYLEYVKLEVTASEKMYNMGEITAADVKACQAQQASIEAQIHVAKNQSSYNNLFLKENKLDYSDYIIKEKKDVESIDSYIEQFPEKNYMTIAGYVTGYQNAIAYMEAKKVEIESITMKLDSARLLYNQGEISKLLLKQTEAELAKAEYELEQYYVEMNLAYVNLKMYCK